MSLFLLLLSIVYSVQGIQEWMNTSTLLVAQVNDDGFGDETNKYAFSMEVFKGSLYVGTFNGKGIAPLSLFFLGVSPRTNGAQIFKGSVSEEDGEWEWSQVVNGGNGNTANFGVRNLRTIGEYLYAVTVDYIKGFEVWRTEDGETWDRVLTDGFGDVDNKSGRGLYAYKGYIYVGVENRRSGANILRRAIQENGDFAVDSEWEEAAQFGLGTPFNFWFSDFVEYGDYMYVGTLNIGGMQLYRTLDGVNYENVFKRGNGRLTEWAAMRLYVYNDRLFLGTMDLFEGASLWANTDGINEGKIFETIFMDGNGNENNDYIWNMREYNNRLYVGTFDPNDNVFSLFSSADPGSDPFIVETDNAFGNYAQYGIRSMAVFQNKLMIGSASAASSCQVYEAVSFDFSESDFLYFAQSESLILGGGNNTDTD